MLTLDFFDYAASVSVTALLNGLGQGLVLLVFVWVALRVVEVRRQLSAATRHVIWAVTLVAMVCLPAGAALRALLPVEAPAAAANEVLILPMPLEEELAPIAENEAQEVVLAPAAPEVMPVRAVEGVEPLLEPLAAPAPVWRLPEVMRQAIPWIFGIWMLGAFIMLARVLRGCLYVYRLKRQSKPLASAYQARLEAWRRRYRLRRRVQIRSVETLVTPVAVGLWKPMILTPASLLDQLTEDEFEQVMLHELAHVQRRDDWTNLLQKIAEAVFFFHPAVHWVGRQMEREREMACDDWVVALTQRPRSYASCLARLVELNVRSRAVFVVPSMAARKRHVFERVQRLLEQGRRVVAPASRAGMLTVVLALVAAFLVVARVTPLLAPPEEEPVIVIHLEQPTLEPVSINLNASLAPVVMEPAKLVLNHDLPEATQLVRLKAPVVLRPKLVTRVETNLALRTTQAMQLRLEASPMVLPQMQEPTAQPEVQEPATQPLAQGVPEDLSVASWIRVLKSATRIGSSGDKTRFLIKTIGRMPDNEEVMAAYIEAARTISSPGDQKRALIGLVSRYRLGNRSLLQVLEAAERLSSDSDKARLLIQVAEVLPNDEALHTAYRDAAKTIGNSSAYRRALGALR